MISPSPTQPSPSPEVPERAQRASTPVRRRTGETPAARFVKAIFRPFFKVFYYVINGIRTHKLYTLLVIVLLVASISATMKISTGVFPLALGLIRSTLKQMAVIALVITLKTGSMLSETEMQPRCH